MSIRIRHDKHRSNAGGCGEFERSANGLSAGRGVELVRRGSSSIPPVDMGEAPPLMVGPGEYQCLGVSEFAEQTPLGGEATGVGPVGIEPSPRTQAADKGPPADFVRVPAGGEDARFPLLIWERPRH